MTLVNGDLQNGPNRHNLRRPATALQHCKNLSEPTLGVIRAIDSPSDSPCGTNKAAIFTTTETYKNEVANRI